MADSGTRTVLVVDVFYDGYATYAELDGRRGHEGDGGFRDQVRDNVIALRGGRTLRYGWVAVFEQPCVAAGQPGRVLAGRGWPGRFTRAAWAVLLRRSAGRWRDRPVGVLHRGGLRQL